MVACPPGPSVTMLVTPLVVTEIGWPTTSAPGAQACASAIPGNAPRTVNPTTIRATNRLFMARFPSFQTKIRIADDQAGLLAFPALWTARKIPTPAAIASNARKSGLMPAPGGGGGGGTASTVGGGGGGTTSTTGSTQPVGACAAAAAAAPHIAAAGAPPLIAVRTAHGSTC